MSKCIGGLWGRLTTCSKAIGTRMQIDPILFVYYSEITFTRPCQMTMPRKGFVNHIDSILCHHMFDVLNGGDMEITAPQCQSTYVSVLVIVILGTKW